MKSLLITGASGFLGWHACKFPQEKWKVTGTYFNHPDSLPPRTDHLRLDLERKDEVWRTLKQLRPDAVFHLAACSSTNYCEENPEASRQTNVSGTAHLSEMCADRKIRLVFTSSEQVFDGLCSSYCEEDTPSPGNEYGRQKLEAEKLIGAIYPDACIARIAVLFDLAGSSNKGFLQQWLESWQAFLPVTAFHDEIRSFLSAMSAVEGLFKLLEQDARGIFHLGGETAMSRYDFALLVRSTLKIKAGKVISKSQQEVKMAAYRPPNLTLNTGKMASLGFQPRHPEAELRRIAAEIILQPGFFAN
ncbi:MAG: hypothetical protein RI973_168 [Bacteroidota bacterium]|jgi:dTDP-4-dehydrorhamnose reductase